MRKFILFFTLLLICTIAKAQSGYEIKINLQNCKDSVAYLAYYQFDKMYVADTCKKVKNGAILFKGKKDLTKGVYFLLSQDKKNYFDFLIDERTQKQELKSDLTNVYENITTVNTKQNDNFFNYIRFIGSVNKRYEKFRKEVKEQKKKDSIAILTKEYKQLNQETIAIEQKVINENKGTYLADLMNLKISKEPLDIPKASNGRPDSVFVYKYTKKHFWDGINFQDDSNLNNPFFANKVKHYFNNMVLQTPDSVCVEIDRMLLKTKQGTKMNMLLLAYFTQNYEIPKIMGMDKVFVYIVDKYFKTGKAKGIYDESVIKLIVNRANTLAPLQLGKIAPELYMIDYRNQEKIAPLGLDKAKNSEEMTKIYFANKAEIEKNYTSLSSIKADYLILLFWDVDCGHCQKEVPKILKLYHDLLNEKKDIKVFSVYTQNDFPKYKKYIEENKLDWINVYDGAHVNNLKEKYDVVTTPVIYILDKNKTIKAKGIGHDNIKDIILAMEKEYKEKK